MVFGDRFWLSRRLYIQSLGFIYFIIGLILCFQGPDLIGPDGLTPVADRVANFKASGQWSELIYRYPSLLWFWSADLVLYVMSALFLVLSLFLVFGFCNFPIVFVLWALQLSLVNGAGLFWGFGWETMMLEMTLLAFFLVHPWRLNLLSRKNIVPNFLMILPLLWMMFRLMLGAGLIKIRGDACWLDFSCMDYHYETQPNPHPLSWYYHFLPKSFHWLEGIMTHFYEILVPFLFLMPRTPRHFGAILIVFFQWTLISTGNLAFLNWQTIGLTLLAFDDKFLLRWSRKKTRENYAVLRLEKPTSTQQSVSAFVLCAVVILSYRPISNMVSPHQRMNQSYDPIHAINSYGLFGSITKQRFEIIISGTSDVTIDQNTRWKEYEFKCKPGAIDRRPCLITPYHLRLDWQMWFSAMRSQISEPWLVNLAKKMLRNDPLVDRQLALNPFADDLPPRYIKMDLYQYNWSKDGKWWTREFVKNYMPRVSLKNFVKTDAK